MKGHEYYMHPSRSAPTTLFPQLQKAFSSWMHQVLLRKELNNDCNLEMQLGEPLFLFYLQLPTATCTQLPPPPSLGPSCRSWISHQGDVNTTREAESKRGPQRNLDKPQHFSPSLPCWQHVRPIPWGHMLLHWKLSTHLAFSITSPAHPLPWHVSNMCTQ